MLSCAATADLADAMWPWMDLASDAARLPISSAADPMILRRRPFTWVWRSSFHLGEAEAEAEAEAEDEDEG